MKNTLGNSVAVTIFGESHGSHIGAVVDGFAPGIPVDEEFIRFQLGKRRPSGEHSTKRQEKDEFQIISGVFSGRTTGTPLCIIIPNSDTKSKDYDKNIGKVRPGHADYTARCKYNGYEDYRGGGHFSGRVTAALVAVGAVAISALNSMGIYIGTHIRECANISERRFKDVKNDILKLNSKSAPFLEEDACRKVIDAITMAANEGDSVGGITETAICGIPAGVGEPWFDSVEGVLSHALFSIPGIKGVEFGMGFDMAKYKGSYVNDAFRIEDGKVYTETNNNGGINGGITNGMPILFSCVVKPTPSIYKEQKTINVNLNENAVLNIEGRHDPAIIHRAAVVIDSVTAISMCDILAQRFGTDFLNGGKI